MVQKRHTFTPNSPSNGLLAQVSEVPTPSQVPQTSAGSQYLPTVNVTELPSDFLPYPEGVEVTYKPYTYGELKRFSQSKLSVKQRYEFILDGIGVSGMPKEKITFQDFLFLALLRKLSSIGIGDILVKYNCQKCGFENSNHVKLDTLDFESLSKNVPDLPANLTINGQDLEFSPLTIEDYFKLYSENKDKDHVAIMAIQCRSHNFKAAMDAIFGANPEDSELLNELDKVFYHGLKTLKFPCANKEAKVEEPNEDGEIVEKSVHCDFTNTVELEDASLIVQPFRGDRKPAKDRIQFGPRNGNKPD